MITRVGQKIGMLTILSEKSIKDKRNKTRREVQCKCDCGQKVTTMRHYIKYGSKISCGCTLTTGAKSGLQLAKENIGKTFNKLKILRVFHKKRSNGKNELWANCQCECGQTKDICYENVKSGAIKSCGCIMIRRSTLGLHKQRPYSIWYGMMRSCYSEEDVRYKRRGSKGIEVIPERRYFTGWREDNKEHYSEEKYFTRINPFKDFTKDNCKREICYNISKLDLYDRYRK